MRVLVKICETFSMNLVREATAAAGLGLTQGYVRCNCTGICGNKRCSCREHGLGCNTKCHPNTPQRCTNVEKEDNSKKKITLKKKLANNLFIFLITFF